MREIEERIKPLTEILNEVGFISTFSSCEGHYDSKDVNRHQASVQFHINGGNEKNFKDIATLILSQTVPHWHETSVEIYKRFYVLPDETELKTDYSINIRPFPKRGMRSKEKRRCTDEAITRIISAVRSYLESSNV